MVQALVEDEIKVFRNDAIDFDSLKEQRPDKIILSPGPGHPANDKDFGICKDVIVRHAELRRLLRRAGEAGIVGHLGVFRRQGGELADSADNAVQIRPTHLPPGVEGGGLAGVIWVGTGPDGRMHLLREVDLAEHAARWAEHHRRARWIAAAEPFIDELGFGMLESDLLASGRSATPRDVYWAAADRALPAIESSGRWDVIRDAYAALATTALDDPDPVVSTERAFELARRAAQASLHLDRKSTRLNSSH